MYQACVRGVNAQASPISVVDVGVELCGGWRGLPARMRPPTRPCGAPQATQDALCSAPQARSRMGRAPCCQVCWTCGHACYRAPFPRRCPGPSGGPSVAVFRRRHGLRCCGVPPVFLPSPWFRRANSVVVDSGTPLALAPPQSALVVVLCASQADVGLVRETLAPVNPQLEPLVETWWCGWPAASPLPPRTFSLPRPRAPHRRSPDRARPRPGARRTAPAACGCAPGGARLRDAARGRRPDVHVTDRGVVQGVPPRSAARGPIRAGAQRRRALGP